MAANPSLPEPIPATHYCNQTQIITTRPLYCEFACNNVVYFRTSLRIYLNQDIVSDLCHSFITIFQHPCVAWTRIAILFAPTIISTPS